MAVKPYTHEEIAELKRRLEHDIHEVESQDPNIRPLPPMDESEAKDTILSLAQAATSRALSAGEAFMIGQLLSAYRMAVQAATLGRRRGRYIVLSEEDLDALMKEKHIRQDAKDLA